MTGKATSRNGVRLNGMAPCKRDLKTALQKRLER